jgi:hypothetical protein
MSAYWTFKFILLISACAFLGGFWFTLGRAAAKLITRDPTKHK